MSERQRFVEMEGPMSRMEYDDGTVVMAADVGPGSDASVDVVGDAAIVVTDDEQYEFDVPREASVQAFIKNGVLTVEVK